MSHSVVAKRYATALFQAAQEQDRLEQTEREWREITDALEGSKELREWLSHPAVTAERKKDTVSKVFPGLSDLTKNLLHLLIDRRRESLIPRIASEYKTLTLDARGFAEAEVISAVPLTEKDQQELVNVFEKKIGKKLIITNRVDSDILGGVIVRIGDRLYDGSLKGKLDRFRKRLAETQVG